MRDENRRTRSSIYPDVFRGLTIDRQNHAWAMVDRYAHLAPEQLAGAASHLDSLLAGYDPAT